ncbi:hypothetical protein NEUTE2DRAFT_146077 [Neurospora tetrasperma FGSC 2509]|nr:hypothetical protein NEUTE2DRAFT_146077 [Neurospora tetrasperma FGSC 2509]
MPTTIDPLWQHQRQPGQTLPLFSFPITLLSPLFTASLGSSEQPSPLFTTMAEEQPQPPILSLESLADHLQKQVNRMDECEKAFSALRKNIVTLNKALDNNTALVQALPKSSSKPKAGLPDVEKFNGAAYTFETWLPSIQAKLRIDGDAIGNAEAQFWYLFSRLDGKIQALVMPQVQQASELQVFDPQDLLDQLNRIYDDPHKVQQAENALYALRQGDEGFGLFMAKFERLLYKAKANLWTEPAKISLIRQALNKDTRKRAQLLRPVPVTYVDYVQKLKEVVNSIHKSKDKDAMEIDAIQAAKKSTATISTLELAGPSRSRAQLHMVEGLLSDDVESDDDDDDDDEEDSGHEFGCDHSIDFELDFERKLERMAYGSRTRC